MITVDFFTNVLETSLQPGQIGLWYLGGAGYVLRTAQTTLLIDPFIGPGHPPEWTRATPPAFAPGQVPTKVDVVLLTHEHDDHTDPVALDAVRLRTEATVIGPKTCIAAVKQNKWPAKRCQILPHHATLVLNDLRITAVPMQDPNAKGCNGYVLECGRTTILHCGDSHYFAGFVDLAKRWSFTAICASVAYSPPGRLLYMDECDAVRAACDAKTKQLIVQHYDLWQGYTLDPQRVVTAAGWYAPKVVVTPAQIGELMLFG